MTFLDEALGLGGHGGRQTYRTKVVVGVAVAVGLAILSVIEYFVAVELSNPLWWLVPFMVAKGALIMEYFMHISDLRHGNGEGH